MKLLKIFALAGSLSLTAGAAVVFQDNFDTENGGVGALNYNGLANWTLDNQSIDLIGNGFYDFYAGNGLYLDMDGSTGSNGNGQISTIQTFAAGNYSLSFLLGNNPGGGSSINYLTVTLGSFSQVFPTTGSMALTPVNLNFSTTGGKLVFSQSGPSDQQGSILDSVVLSSATPTPEPATWAMLLGAGALFGGFRRFRKQ